MKNLIINKQNGLDNNYVIHVLLNTNNKNYVKIWIQTIKKNKLEIKIINARKSLQFIISFIIIIITGEFIKKDHM